MRWRRSIAAPTGVVCGLLALSAWGLIGGCGGPSYVRGPDGGATGGAGDGTGGGPDASGGTPGSGGGGEPIATGGTGTAGSGGVASLGGRSGTGGGSGGMGSPGGATTTGTGGGLGGGVGGRIASSGGVPAATGGRGTGGAATGGNGSGGGGTGGANTGGANTGGANTGGANTGGANTGGAATGGMGTGGAPAPSGAILYYPFDETTGSTVADQSGNARNGTVSGGGTFGAGMVRNGLTFAGGTTTGTSTYVSIPVGLLTSTRDMTISLWVKVTAAKTWQRILDFSKSTTTGYMFLTTHGGTSTPNVVRFGITATGNTAEQRIDVPLLPLDTWKHLALVFSSTGVSFFVDGVKAATSTALTLRPADLGAFTNQWLGRSVFTQDPYFAGQLDELRIYGRALSDAEVGVLYTLR
jgi:hypothetical protein